MATRNFWLSADIDGRKTTLAGGPRRKDGGFELDVWMRVEGRRARVCRIIGTANPTIHEGNGETELRIQVADTPDVRDVGDETETVLVALRNAVAQIGND